jgi:hypothetical protein
VNIGTVVLQRVKEDWNVVQTIKRRRANWIGHILLRNFLLRHVIEGQVEGWIEGTRRRGRRCKKLLDGPKEKRGCCKLKKVALEHMWRTRLEEPMDLS